MKASRKNNRSNRTEAASLERTACIFAAFYYLLKAGLMKPTSRISIKH